MTLVRMPEPQNLVHVLRDASGMRSVGYRLSGALGPAHGLISGHRRSIGFTFNQLVLMQDLPALNGSLTLLSVDALELMAPDDFAALEPEGGYSGTLTLPALAQSQSGVDAEDGTLGAVLHFCRQLQILPPQDGDSGGPSTA